MESRSLLAPGGPLRGRPGVFVFLALVLVVPACERPGTRAEPAVLELGSDTIRLDPGVTLVDVLLLGAAEPVVRPDTVRIRTGDVVRFVAGDAVAHAVAFDRARLPLAAQQFLARTGQLRGPPLIAADAAWVVSFASAPPGAYPFTDLSQAVGGVVLVSPAPPAER